jgi:hypothetical protein
MSVTVSAQSSLSAVIRLFEPEADLPTNLLNMKNSLTIVTLILSLVAASYLTAQSIPTVYYGPYEQPSATQFEGEWIRSDGTYKMVVAVDEAGTIAAQYFNPSAIHVESTSVSSDEERGLIMTVVLRDQGYPGSSYELQYLPQFRILVGLYQIPGKEPAEVYFTQ